MIEYSRKELLLIEHFGLLYAADHVQPPLLYTMMASQAFISNDQTEYAHSLRRCIEALSAMTCY